MPFTIPSPFVWDTSFEVFYAQLDDEHRGLFQGLFDVAGAPNNMQTLARLTGLMAHHFKYEECCLQRSSYSDYPTHKKLHDEFMNKLFAIHTPVADTDVHFMKDWLVNHIKVTDFKYKSKLNC